MLPTSCRRQPFYHVEAARWLAENAPAGSPVMTRYTDTTLYAGLPKVAFPNAAWPEVLAYGQARGARYLVVNSWEIEEVRPYLAPLLTPEDGQPAARADFSSPASKTRTAPCSSTNSCRRLGPHQD